MQIQTETGHDTNVSPFPVRASLRVLHGGTDNMAISTAKFGAETEMSKFLTRRLDELRQVKSQRAFSAEMGFPKPNVLSMMKLGETKVPLERLQGMSRALGVDLSFMFRLWVQQYYGESGSAVVEELFRHTVTANEMRVTKALREVLEDDRQLSPAQTTMLARFADLIKDRGLNDLDAFDEFMRDQKAKQAAEAAARVKPETVAE